MREIFEEIFWEVAEELGFTAWYELFDSSEFDTVENRIAERFNVESAEDLDEFVDWYNEMAMDL